MDKKYTLQAKEVKLILDDTFGSENDAIASINLNPNVTWLKLVLTDSKPNGNNERIPEEEFSSIIKTGKYMPIKMAKGKIEPGHENSEPLGSLAHLLVQDEEVVALAALWNRERPDDVEYITERYNSGKSIDVSWEISYVKAEASESGVRDLRGVNMNAVTIVGNPAYKGRTPVIAVASSEDKKVEELKDQIKKLEEKIKELEADNETLEKEASNRTDEVKTLTEEVESLREFKEEVESERAEAAKIDNIVNKFAEAGVKLEDDYLEEKREMLLGLSDDQLDFFIQELVSFASKDEEDEETEDDSSASISITTKSIPDVRQSKTSTDDLLSYLKENTK